MELQTQASRGRQRQRAGHEDQILRRDDDLQGQVPDPVCADQAQDLGGNNRARDTQLGQGPVQPFDMSIQPQRLLINRQCFKSTAAESQAFIKDQAG